jgi:sterol desaturase/sphingolipid hydroxylase (fatty acid hydroxylase superfamily)
MDFNDAKTIVGPVILALLWLGEGWIPFYDQFRGRFRDRLRHDGKNLALGLGNAALLALLFAVAFARIDARADRAGFGLLRLVTWPSWAGLLVAFVLIDLWMYLWHRANHAIPFLWRFHRMHHSDPAMDATTGVRFHTGEVVLSALARLAVVPLLGVSLRQLAVYEAVFLPIVLFHHSNVNLPRRLDHGLLALIVTPAMHRVHHSRWRPETDSNYGSVFPCWDRLFGTFRLRGDARTIHLGLDGLDTPEWQGLRGMLTTPLGPLTQPGSAQHQGS